jgi:flagellar basal-body rod protein FlgC
MKRDRFGGVVMAFVSTIDVIGSGFTAQQQRLDVISENIVNMNTTRTENGEGPYRRKVTVFEAEERVSRFQDVLERARLGSPVRSTQKKGGVRVVGVEEDPSDFKLKYDPTDPDANEEGYVELPNVDLVKEITDGMAASQAYSANVTAFNLLKSVISKGLEIGK